MRDQTDQLTRLGSQQTVYPTRADVSILETFPNRYPGRDYVIRHVTSEFTSLCPKTGQPDFATIDIEMVADVKCIESKSLKLYLFAYRGEGSFMETITNRILEDLVAACAPRRCKVVGAFNARGGVATTVVAEYVRPT